MKNKTLMISLAVLLFLLALGFTVKPSPGRASKRADYPYVG